MSLRSPRSSRGFVPIGVSNGNTENGIPLQQVRSNASSTGARKANQGLSVNFMDENKPDDATNEKHGMFHRGRRRAKKDNEGQARNDTPGSDEYSINAMGKLYYKIIGFSVVTRYLLYIIPVGLVLAVPLIVIPVTGNKDVQAGHGPCVTDKDENTTCAPGPKLFNLFVWIECMWVSVWVCKLVAHLIPSVFMFLVGFVSAGTRKYAEVIRALEIPLSLFFWALTCFLIYTGVFTSNFDNVSWVNSLKKVLGSLLVSSAIFLGEKAIVQLISITYHQRSFANRISDSKREVHLLSLMYDASRNLFPMYSPEFEEEDIIINDSIEVLIGKKKKKGGQDKVTVNPMALIAEAGGKVGRFGDKVTSVFGHVASEITGKQVFNPNAAHSIVVEALEKTRTSEALAKRIWMSFVVEGKDALYVEDIVEVLGAGHREDAEECFAAVDADGNGDISLDEMIRKVVEIGKERKAITHSMKDIGQALTVFDNILLFAVLLLVIFVFLAFFQSSFVTTLATAGTALLSLSFVFAVTTQEFLGSCIFLFVKHPYDVGDRVDITGPSCERLVVERISLLYTVFIRIDKMQTVQVPNIILNNLWIENVTRSKAMKELIDVNVSYDTSFEDIELLRQELENFVRAPENSRDFLPEVLISVGGVNDLDKMTLQITVKHKSNWHNEAVRITRRSKFMCALTLAMKRVPIYAPGGGGEVLGGPTNPTYSVSVSDEIATASREKAEKDKEAARMVHSDSKANDSPEEEMKAAQNFNSINPVSIADDWGSIREEDTQRTSNLEARRSNDGDSHRLSLQKSHSVGGRRRAGDVAPRRPSAAGSMMSQRHGPESMPGFQVTQHMRPFDEEAQLGGPNPYHREGSSRGGGSAHSGAPTSTDAPVNRPPPAQQHPAPRRDATGNNPYQQH